MRLFIRPLSRIAAALGVLILLTVSLVAGALWLSLPADDLAEKVPGLLGPISISLDADGVPRIKAGSERDGAAALGFLHARDRLFQMELMRRAASGRLSEIAGPGTLRLDRMMRTLGLRQSALADLEVLPDDTREMLEAYARGVNAWIALKGRFAAPEFLILGPPEPWQPVDSLLWAKTMGLWLSMNWRQELARLALVGKIPKEKLDELWPRLEKAPSTEAMAAPDMGAAAAHINAVLPAFPYPFTLPQTASNEWAVDGRHTASGAPLLAGDPHLAFSFPGIWYLARIDLPGHVLAGATAPGIPFLVLGHNGKIAWSFTSTGADVQDIFVETPAGPKSYSTPDGPRSFAVREERIAVRGQPEQVLIVRESRHGPIISDLDRAEGPVLAVAMGNLQRGDTAATGLLALNRAESVQQAGTAASKITSPVQNLLVADRQTIGLFVTGRVPIRKAGDGATPAPGDGSHDWIGWLDGLQLPHVISPASGRLVNANEPVALPGNTAFMGRDQFGSWRADRIRQRLSESDGHTATQYAAMQCDVVDLFAGRTLPILTAAPVSDGLSAEAVRLLKGWDGSADMTRPEPLIFTAWIDAFYQAALRRAGLQAGIGAPVADFVSFVLTPEGNGWCGGDCKPLLRQSLDAALSSLRERFGDNPAHWQWGQAHRATFAHPLLGGLPLAEALGRIAIDAPGDDDTIDRGGHDAELRSVEGPSYRGVYDLADLDRSLFMLAPGQSGHLLSPHASDFLIRWRDGRTIRLGPKAQRETGRLNLLP